MLWPISFDDVAEAERRIRRRPGSVAAMAEGRGAGATPLAQRRGVARSGRGLAELPAIAAAAAEAAGWDAERCAKEIADYVTGREPPSASTSASNSLAAA